MTSMRPKLKAETPKALTAWDTATGEVVWLTEAGDWTRNPDKLAVLSGDAADAALEAAKNQEDIVTDPYFMQVSETGQIEGREILREQIRARGPTVAYGEDAL